MATKSNKAIKISQKHLLGIQDLSINDVNFILNEAKSFIELNKSKNKNNIIYLKCLMLKLNNKENTNTCN